MIKGRNLGTVSLTKPFPTLWLLLSVGAAALGNWLTRTERSSWNSPVYLARLGLEYRHCHIYDAGRLVCKAKVTHFFFVTWVAGSAVQCATRWFRRLVFVKDVFFLSRSHIIQWRFMWLDPAQPGSAWPGPARSEKSGTIIFLPRSDPTQPVPTLLLLPCCPDKTTEKSNAANVRNHNHWQFDPESVSIFGTIQLCLPKRGHILHYFIYLIIVGALVCFHGAGLVVDALCTAHQSKGEQLVAGTVLR